VAWPGAWAAALQVPCPGCGGVGERLWQVGEFGLQPQLEGGRPSMVMSIASRISMAWSTLVPWRLVTCRMSR
jgi:hypothetical protein